MKKFIAYASAFILLGYSLPSCTKVTGIGPVVPQTRAVSNFNGISVGICGNVIYKVDTAYKLEIEAQKNILDIIETFVTGSNLIIRFKPGINVRSHEDITINISGPSPSSVTVSGSADVKMLNNIYTDDLKLVVSGSGRIIMPNTSVANKIDGTVSGSGSIEIYSGSSKTESLRISGSGNIHISGVATEKVKAEISGSGNMRVFVSQELEAHISGSGSVYYLGTPAVTTHISGSGRVVPL